MRPTIFDRRCRLLCCSRRAVNKKSLACSARFEKEKENDTAAFQAARRLGDTSLSAIADGEFTY